MLEGWMERISLSHLFGYLLKACRYDVTAVLGLFHLLCIFLGDIGYHPIIWEFVYQPFFEYFVDFVTRQLHRSNGHSLTAGFLLQIGDGISQCLALGIVAARQIGDDDTTIWQFHCCAHQGAKTVNHHVGQGAIAKDLSAGIVQIRGKLVKQYQRGMIANDFLPIALVYRFWAIDPVRLYGF